MLRRTMKNELFVYFNVKDTCRKFSENIKLLLLKSNCYLTVAEVCEDPEQIKVQKLIKNYRKISFLSFSFFFNFRV